MRSGPRGPIVVASAIALAEKVPDPALRPASLALHTGESVDLDDVTVLLADAGYDRVDQVEERGQFAVRGGILDVCPATEEQAIRVELFGDEIESMRRFSVFTQRSLGDAERVELAPAAEISAEHRDQLMRGRAAAEGEARPVHGAFIAPLDLVPTEALVVLASAEEIPGALHDHWEDVTGSIEEKEARELYADVAEPLQARASLSLGPDAGQEHSFRAQRAEFPSRTLAEAEGELEKLTRSGYRSVVAFEGRGEAERTRFNLSRLDVPFLGEAAPRDAGVSFAEARLREGFLSPELQLAVIPQRRLIHRRAAARSRPGPGSPRRSSCGSVITSSTRTTASLASRASTRRRSPASPATTSSSSTGAATASSRRRTSSRESAGMSAPTATSRSSARSAASAGRT